MKIKTGFICNMANISRENTINALGIISNMVVSELPVTVAPLTLMMVIEGTVEERKGNKLEIQFANPAGMVQLDPMSLTFDFTTFNNLKRRDLYHTLYVFLPPITFNLEGNYEFKVRANGKEVGSLVLPVYKN